ncbi:TraB/GumN family protein [Neisseria sp. P0019.S003]|uniref:TraB/GumN family protein n=1 Tax=Neisseria sp. P0019.S003 TaxID=3436799 RepID=UPI003F7DF20C
MKKLLACLLVPLTALALGACKPASTSPESKPAELNLHQPKLTSNVWKISKEGQPDSYLLGTIHMGQTNQTLSSDALKLLQSTDQLTTEVDALPDSSPETKRMYQKYFKEVMSTEPLSRKLGKTDFRLLQEIYSKNEENRPIAQIADKLHPWAAFIFAGSTFPQGYSSETGADMLLTNAAADINKPRGSLESLDEVSAIFKAQPEETMINFLKASIKTNKEETEDVKKLHQAYSDGRFEELIPLLEETEQRTLKLVDTKYAKAMSDWLKNDLLIRRNLAWLPEIRKQSAKQSTLFAVGIAHLPSEKGLIELLRQEGYQVTPEPKVLIWQ